MSLRKIFDFKLAALLSDKLKKKQNVVVRSVMAKYFAVKHLMIHFGARETKTLNGVQNCFWHFLTLLLTKV